ncbi:MAG: hypothetical protein K6G22_01450 [Lachnospiraceae bacterium]|nr:hypothetical protein [Lachnospiraceae bacterium]
MRRKGIILLLSFLISVMFLSGCGGKDQAEEAESAESIEKQEKLVAEYAAGLLMKYDKGGHNGLTYYIPTPEPTEEPEPEQTEEDTTDGKGSEGKNPTVSVSGVSDEIENLDNVSQIGTMPESEDQVTVPASIAEYLGAGNVDIRYTSYEICDQYPEEQSDGLFFSMSASDGRKLLILHFDLSNNSGADTECSILASDAKIRILINDTERINQQMTILLNDLKSFDGTVAAGEVIDSVLVFEIPEETAANINSLKLIIVNADGEQTIAL